MDARGGVVGLGRKAHPPGIGGGHQALPGEGGGLAVVVYLLLADLHLLRPVLAQLAGRGLPQALQHRAAGQLRRPAVQVRAGGGGGRGGVGHLGRAGGLQAHPLPVDGEGAGGHLAQLAVHPLPHLHRPGGQAHAAVGVHVHQGPGLVEGLVGEGDAEAHGHQGQALLGQEVGAVELRHLPAPLLQMVAGLGRLPAAAGLPAVEALPVRQHVPVAQQVPLLHRRRAQAQGLGQARRWPPPSPAWPAARRSRGRPCWRAGWSGSRPRWPARWGCGSCPWRGTGCAPGSRWTGRPCSRSSGRSSPGRPAGARRRPPPGGNPRSRGGACR